jgi:hypothetical protein
VATTRARCASITVETFRTPAVAIPAGSRSAAISEGRVDVEAVDRLGVDVEAGVGVVGDAVGDAVGVSVKGADGEGVASDPDRPPQPARPRSTTTQSVSTVCRDRPSREGTRWMPRERGKTLRVAGGIRR